MIVMLAVAPFLFLVTPVTGKVRQRTGPSIMSAVQDFEARLSAREVHGERQKANKSGTPKRDITEKQHAAASDAGPISTTPSLQVPCWESLLALPCHDIHCRC